MISGLKLADIYPFAIISILSATVIISRRERANAIVLSWLAREKDDLSTAKGVVIRANFKPGTLTEFRVLDGRWLVYRTPLVVHPDLLLTYSLLACILYYVFYLQASHNPVILHDTTSTLGDYLAILWWFLVLMVILLWRTWKYYSACLQDLVGTPICGRLRHGLFKLTDALNHRVLRVSNRRIWLKRIACAFRLLVPIAALSSLALPWMEAWSGVWRGYRFLLPQRPSPSPFSVTLEPRIYLELQIQLMVAVLFVAFYLVNCFLWRSVAQAWLIRILEVWRYLGIAIVLLAGNLILHLVMLEYGGYVGVTNSLVFAEPLYGFWIFVALCFVLSVLVQHRLRHTRLPDSTPRFASETTPVY